MTVLKEILGTFWQFLCDVTGENDYPRYCARERAQGRQPVTRQAFYLWKINRQYSRISRCC